MILALIKVLSLSVLLSLPVSGPAYNLLLNIWPDLPWPFSRVFDRVFMFFLLVFFWVYRSQFKFSNLFAGWKRESKKVLLQRFLLGFLLASLSSLISLLLIYNFTNQLILKEIELVSLALKILKILVSAFVISIIEEVFFRSLLFNSLLSRFSLLRAVLFGSLIYSFVHFIAPDKKFVLESYSWDSGFIYFYVLIANIFQPDILRPGFGLFLVGLLLYRSIFTNGSLALCIGFHTAWVTFIKLTKTLFQVDSGETPKLPIVERYFLLESYYVWISVLLLWIFNEFYLKRKIINREVDFENNFRQ